MSKTRLLCHIVFGTRERRPTIGGEYKVELYRYIMKIINNSRCTNIRINGAANHLHILIDLNPTVALASLMKDIKFSTSRWMKNNPKFPDFDSWGKGYFASSVSPNSANACIKYIETQQSHHATRDYVEEMKIFCQQYGLQWFEDDWK